MTVAALAAGVLAGLTAAYGLYCALIPPMLYVVLGRSIHISLGTFGLTSILLNLSLQKVLPDPTSQTYDPNIIANRANVAITMAFVVGLFQVAIAFFRLGFITNYLSPPLVSGFTTAAAIFIWGR